MEGPGSKPRDPPPAALEIPTERLLALNRLKQRLEVPLAKAAASLALNDLVEDCRPVLYRSREDLQHVSFIVAIDQNTEPLQLLNRLINFAHAALQLCIVRVRHRQKADTLLLHLRHSRKNVLGGQRHVLHAWTTIEVQILFNLRLPSALRRLIDWELHIAISIRHHLRHQRGVFGRNVLVVKMLIQRKPHYSC